jgi:DNA polymerase
MYRVVMADPTSLDEFKRHVRGLIAAKIAPADLAWTDDPGADLFADTPPADRALPTFAVPASYVELARDVLCHRDGERFALLYELLWRILYGERALLSIFSDPLVYRLRQMQKSVRRDLHKMTAFVRFRKIEDADGELFIAWFEPQHLVLRPAAEFFAKRFTNMRWSILTPDGSMSWNGCGIVFGPPVPKSSAPQGDTLEEWWRSYYRSTFNPARANLKQMQQEMPARYWINLPEASLIPELLAQASNRTQTMIQSPPTAPRKSSSRHVAAIVASPEQKPAASLSELKEQAKGCERCPLYKDATQTVFGEGPADARVIFVGEQPGDQEDLAGKPFVGPAGQIFDKALGEAGVNRDKVYVTNAVKHFKFLPRGKRRIHQKPNVGEIDHCRWWLDREIALVQPELIVALGATAARAVLGHDVKITKERGSVVQRDDGSFVFLTVHPSYLLRLPDEAQQRREYARFVGDLSAIGKRLPAVRLAA